MKKFVVLYNAKMSAADMMANVTPDQMKAGMDLWMAWAQKAGSAVIDLGLPIQPLARVGSGSISENDSQATGYSILQGESKDEITALLKDHPHLQTPGGASIDVYEAMQMPGM